MISCSISASASRLLNRMRFDRLMPSTQYNSLASANPQTGGDRHSMQQGDRNDQPLIDCLTVLTQPCCDVHRVAEIGELTFGIATFADEAKFAEAGRLSTLSRVLPPSPARQTMRRERPVTSATRSVPKR